MYEEATIMFLYCETSMHAGSGTSLGAIDLPIQREAYTNFPTIAGSGIKGALREWFEVKVEENAETKDAKKEKITIVFGPETDGSEHAGAVAFTDAKILLFPVRSLRGLFTWITCPTILARLVRDIELAKGTCEWKMEVFDNLRNGKVYGTETNQNKISDSDLRVVLEEFTLDFSPNDEVTKIAKWISANVISQKPEYKFWKEKIITNLLVLSDNDFSDFVQHSTEVNARIRLGDGKSSDTKHGGNLFYEENLPAESVLYSTVLASIPHKKENDSAVKKPKEVIEYIKTIKDFRIQIGGDETVGKGIVKPTFLDGGTNVVNK
ncbi:MAG: hypothetical protein FD122_3248 [Stygiobacter sp.]|nr:MAG: hypothetical protein FD122_3248 [Stygiobacter sp.]